MAFQTKDLSVLAYANGFTLWHYTTADPAVALTKAGPGYFDPAYAMLRAGDIVLPVNPWMGSTSSSSASAATG